MKKLTILFVGALVALLAASPVAGAKGKRHRTVTVCGIVDATSVLPTTLVLATGGTRTVTIQNSKPVTIPADVVTGADVCARAKVVRNPDHTRTKVLLAVKVRPAASVEATGPVTLGSGQITSPRSRSRSRAASRCRRRSPTARSCVPSVPPPPRTARSF